MLVFPALGKLVASTPVAGTPVAPLLGLVASPSVACMLRVPSLGLVAEEEEGEPVGVTGTSILTLVGGIPSEMEASITMLVGGLGAPSLGLLAAEG
jgi:hypothetical protein